MKTLSHIFCLMVLFLVLPSDAAAQRQSGRVYEFLGLSSTARITASGGHAFPALDNDPGMALHIPALLNREMDNHLSLNFVDYFDDINYGTVAFTRFFEGLGQFSGSLQYINYGSFVEANHTGQVTGQFSAGEYSFQVGWGRPLSENFSIGSNMKLIYSSFHDYSSFGVAVDVSVAYFNPEQQLAASLVARNAGRQLTYYHDGSREPLPFDLVLGVSKELANAPFRFSLVANNLHNYNLTYDSPVLLPGMFDNQQEEEDKGVNEQIGDLGDNLMRHLVAGVEFIPGENFTFRIGYNYRRRQEMKVDTRLSTVGFSWGFGMQISRFRINYGRSNYHLAGAPNHLSVSTSLQDLFLD
ncbi:MAG: type IX secretion system protein PorQ [Bacteroidales bacterium]